MKNYVVIENGCWIWLLGHYKNGYGSYKSQYAHRYMYEKYSGRKIKKGLILHHKCFNRECVNPNHLMLMSNIEHIKLHTSLITECSNGHKYNEENTRWYKGHRICRTCHRVDQGKRDFKKRTQPLINKIKEAIRLNKLGIPKIKIAKMLKISRRTAYRYAKFQTNKHLSKFIS